MAIFVFPDGREVQVPLRFQIIERGRECHASIDLSALVGQSDLPPFELDAAGGEDPAWCSIKHELGRLTGFNYLPALRRRLAEEISPMCAAAARARIRVRYDGAYGGNFPR